MNIYMNSCLIVLCIQNLILGVTDGLSLPRNNPRACVIGAGYSGLGTARYLKQYGVDFTVFEATKYLGGTWRFDPHVGVDEDGLPLFTSMYKNLRINTPKQFMEYYDFPFPEETVSFPSSSCMYNYLKAFAKKFDLLDHIQYKSFVTSLTWSDNRWNLTYMISDTKQSVSESCDFVVIASGEYSQPVWPKIKGQELFQGKMIHSHDYKSPEPYTNRRVLIVGAGASGLDLAVHLSNVTSKLVHSHHLVYNQPPLPKGYIKKPDIHAFTETGAMFNDGSVEEFDEVIFCTGYNYAHPFLDETSGVTATGKFVLPLYRHVVNIKHPSMMFVGVSKKVINKVLDAQGHYAAALVAGKFELPPQDEMLKSWLEQVYDAQRKGSKIVDVNVIGTDMDQYFGNLTMEAGIPRVPPVFTKMRDFNMQNRYDDFLNFREYQWRIIDDNNYERKYAPSKELTCPIEV